MTVPSGVTDTQGSGGASAVHRPTVSAGGERAVHRTLEGLALVLGPVSERSFTVRLWDGTVERPPGEARSRFTLVLSQPGSLRAMLLPPSELQLAEAFIRGEFDVEGDLEAALELDGELRDRLVGRRAVRLLAALARLPRSESAARAQLRLRQRGSAPAHSPQRDAAAIRAHYDVGNEFFALWLDRRLVYSCAYFETGDESLDTAQRAKLEHLCRKLRLRPGDRLLDVGCGWGGLIIHAAAKYGVHALGITLSEAQAALARQRIAAAGLADRCRVEVCDYRDLPTDEPFDKVVSVGMVEHVGHAQLDTYAQQLFRLTAPGGLFLNHGIVAPPTPPGLSDALRRRLWREGAFIDQYVFPDGEILQVGELIAAGESAGFETRDVESLREHYTQTLRHWVRRLEIAAPDAVRLVGAQAYRTWRLYMAGSAHAFATGRLRLAQVLFAKPDAQGVVVLPRTRADLYR
jgi:cyclopropane-fatty-acyl-phospholipid synthase